MTILGGAAKRADGDAEAAVYTEVGVVDARREGATIVATRSGEFAARRAVSCLVEPEVGDRVLLAVPPAGELYVLAVLDRPSDEPLTVVVDRDLKVKLPTGRLSLAAADGVDIASSGDVRVAGRAVELNGKEGQVFFERLSYVGRLVHAEVDRVKSSVGLFDSVLERFSQRVKRAYRFVEEIDVLRADQIDHRAKSNMHLHAENSLVTAEKLVKVDGDQIHLG